MIAKYIKSSLKSEPNILKVSMNNVENSDANLIQRCLKGERLAQSQLYKKWYNMVFSICLRYATDRDEAKNMVNESFFKVFKNLGKISSAQALASWMKKITINTCIDHIRSNQKLKFLAGDELPDQGIESEVISRLGAEDILRALQKVTPASKIVFSLYVIEGYKHDEIAGKLKIKTSTSRWHLMNAKKELKELLKAY